MEACADRAQQDEVDLEDKEDQFQPQLGNVVFASAHDGWAFRVGQMAKQYADKLGCNVTALEQAFWGDFAFQTKTKRIIKIKPDQTHKHKSLFVQVCIQSLQPAQPFLDYWIQLLRLLTRNRLDLTS